MAFHSSYTCSAGSTLPAKPRHPLQQPASTNSANPSSFQVLQNLLRAISEKTACLVFPGERQTLSTWESRVCLGLARAARRQGKGPSLPHAARTHVAPQGHLRQLPHRHKKAHCGGNALHYRKHSALWCRELVSWGRQEPFSRVSFSRVVSLVLCTAPVSQRV